MPGYPMRFANDYTDRLYFVSERGLVVCIRERDRDFPLYHRNPNLQPILPEFAPEESKSAPASAKAAPAGEKSQGEPQENQEKN